MPNVKSTDRLTVDPEFGGERNGSDGVGCVASVNAAVPISNGSDNQNGGSRADHRCGE